MLKLLGDLYGLVFARRCFRRLNMLLYYLALRGLGILNYESAARSGESHFIRTRVGALPGPVVLDVGANVGAYAVAVREANPSARIHCFEPHPLTFRRLQDNIAALGIQVTNAGVGSARGQLKLYDYADNDGSSHASLYHDVITDLRQADAVVHEVGMITLDDFVIEQGIERVHLLKIDTEGHELEVLKGFRRFIDAGRIDMIHFEFNEMNSFSRVFFRDFWLLLSNYDFYRMLPGGLLPIKAYNPLACEIFAYQNIVAIRRHSGNGRGRR